MNSTIIWRKLRTLYSSKINCKKYELNKFRLANELDVDDTEEEIRQFRDKNADKIERNKRKPSKDDLWIRAMLEEEQNRQRKLQDEYAKDEMEKDQNRAMFNPKAIIDELRSSDLPAEVVLDRQRKKQIEHEMAEKEEAQRKKRDKLGWNIYITLIHILHFL